MKAANIYFDVHDKEYFSRLGEYMILKYPMHFNIVQDRETELPTYLVTDYLNKRNSRNIIVIKSEDGDISKYSKASDICIKMIEMIFDSSENIPVSEADAPMTICVTSGVGGRGKTTIAKGMAVCYMNQGYKVLYINTDTSSAGETKTREDKFNNLDRLMYYLESAKRMVLLESLAEAEIETGLKCICNRLPSPENPPDARMSKLLMKRLKKEDRFEYIIIDYPSCICGGLVEIIRGSNHSIFVTGNDKVKRERLFLEYLDTVTEKKMIEVRNRCNSGDMHIPDKSNDNNDLFRRSIRNLIKLLED